MGYFILEEIYEAIQRENIEAMKTKITDLKQLDTIFKEKEKSNDRNKKEKNKKNKS